MSVDLFNLYGPYANFMRIILVCPRLRTFLTQSTSILWFIIANHYVSADCLLKQSILVFTGSSKIVWKFNAPWLSCGVRVIYVGGLCFRLVIFHVFRCTEYYASRDVKYWRVRSTCKLGHHFTFLHYIPRTGKESGTVFLALKKRNFSPGHRLRDLRTMLQIFFAYVNMRLRMCVRKLFVAFTAFFRQLIVTER